MSAELHMLAEKVLKGAQQRKLSIVTAESCTAGKLSSLLAGAPGAAQNLFGGFVTYTKNAKSRVLGVSEDLLRKKGSVCRDVALAMAQGALERADAGIALAITGVAGPEPDEDNNPVGLVCLAVICSGGRAVHAERRYGQIGRENILNRAMADALTTVLNVVEGRNE